MLTHEKVIDLSNEVTAHLGTFGKYNSLKMILLWFPLTMSGMFYLIFIFTAGVTDYRCKITECEHQNDTNWTLYAIPRSTNGKLDKCSRFANQDRVPQHVDKCSREWFNNQSVVICDEYIYGEENTVSKEFDLGCQEWKRTLVGTIRGVGLVISQILCGVLSDRFGRKFILILCSILSGLTGLIKSFSPNYETFMVLEFSEAVIAGGILITAFTLLMEMITPKERIITQSILLAGMFVGGPLLGLVSWSFQDWRMTVRILQTPILLVFTYIWLIDESVRWLANNGRKDEAITILRKAVRFNFRKGNIPESLKHLFQEVDNQTNIDELEHLTPEKLIQKQEMVIGIQPIKINANDQFKEVPIRKVLKSPKLRLRILIVVLIWIGTALNINGLAIYGVQFLPGNKHLNFVLLNIADPLLHFMSMFATLRYGRKKVMAFGYILSSMFCFIVIAVPANWKIVLVILYLLSQYCTKLCYNSLIGITSEIFPTNLRSTFIGVGMTAGKIGFIIASQVPLLASYLESLPVILFGTISLSMIFTLIPLPETVNVELPDTIKEAEDMKTRRIV